MKKLFLAIRHNDLNLVRSILEKQPSLISCVSTGVPKKDILCQITCKGDIQVTFCVDVKKQEGTK